MNSATHILKPSLRSSFPAPGRARAVDLELPLHALDAQRPLRIALVTETYPPEVNGVALSVARLVEGLRGRGHHVHLVRPRQPEHDATRPADDAATETLVAGLPIPRYPELRLGLPATGRLLKLWRQQQPDLVHIATEGPLGWAAQRAADRLGMPVISEFRTNFHAYSQHYGLAWLRPLIEGYLRRFHNRCALTMVPSEAQRQRLVALGFERLLVVARGVDTERFNPRWRSQALRQQWGAEPDTPVLLSVGRLAAEKNLNLLIKAYEGLLQQNPQARLVLVGHGPERERLQQACPQAIFSGQKTGMELAEHYASADLFGFPSLTETFGNVVPEAMASGLPVVAFDEAAAALLLRDGAGLLLNPGDEEGFCQAVASLGTHPAQRHSMARRALCTVADHGWERIVSEVEAQYRQHLQALIP
ncbi:glycosyltransferase involved in cell wall biosynthesis [Inhella inkyongensis]|uniref:Glycosyltransferase involved in cell wall biosynthesis n=1 Tax=Inhella inkyongensis TaxID=392593 RepID=A0A840S5U4_9BURK|nr:glycosyltransferase family 1 protein [Inhella inkyongensis]MBB5203870.1 glycosyltransferase involved in cell wall biosynthesis [Inhella inkyongensis]